MSCEPRYPDLPAPYKDALHGVIPWIITTCAPTAIIVCGSVIRGEGDRGSDLDLQVIHDQPWRQRLQRFSICFDNSGFAEPMGRTPEI
jgi:hypothetical protein